MMRISQREKVLLGYPSPQHNNCSSKVTNNRDSNSDIDFSDVFGGPPRRSSIHEIQHGSYNNDDTDLKSSCFDGDVNLDEGSKFSRSSWSGYGEKPVFGVESLRKSRNRSDDFFDDIFTADQSLSYSSRMGARDPSASAPGSRVLSPAARPLSSRAQPFGSPAQLSLPAGLPNTDSIASSPCRSNDGMAGHSVSSGAFLSRFSSQAIQNQDVLAHSTNRQSQLSELFNREALAKEPASVGTNDRADFTEDLERSEVPNEGSQFHFSIHKWATKGMPLIMSLTKRNSLRSREKSKLERCLSTEDSETNSVFNETHVTGRSAEEYSHVTAQPQSITQYSHQNIKETVPLDNYILKGSALFLTSNSQPIVESGNSDVECITSQPLSRPQNSRQNINWKVPVDNCVSVLSEEETKESTLAPKKMFVDVDDEIHQIVMDKGKRNVRTVPICQVEEKKVKDEVTTKDGNAQRVAKAIEILPPDGASFEHKKNGKLESFGEKLEKIEISGKVKDFIKIFNQESSSKSTINVDGQCRSHRWKDTNSSKVENQAPFETAKEQNGIQVPDINEGKEKFYNCTMVKGKDKSLGQKVANVNRFHENRRTSPEKENIAVGKEPIADNSKPSTSRIDLTYEDVYVVTELPNTEKPSEDAQHQEEIQASENKIQSWSKGKEGNIRALLSTLQYVLWPNSGWKPVPLVDIIEANTVKRAYQKALLCLHPDKLQQKGAASHQKYIAQKVFDILQEAWDHFNSLGTL